MSIKLLVVDDQEVVRSGLKSHFAGSNIEIVGEASDGDSTLVMFVRTSRLFRFKDDITMRIEDQGRERVVTGESRSRVGKGDLGQNPRNLRRLMTELRAVLDGAVRQEPQR